MTKVGRIQVDLYDCIEEGERLFRVHGFNDMLDTNSLVGAMNFLMDQAYTLISANAAVRGTGVKYGEVTADHPMAKHFKVFLDGKILEHCLRVNDITGEALVAETVDGKLVYELYQGVIKLELDDNSEA